tara:strand:+ start:977 stop:2059 length:1083 start_codon:yes stop_codon:yes gene_type:complete
MSNPFSGDTTTTGARAGNAAYNNLSSEATDETDAIAAIPGSIGGGLISKISETAGASGGTKVEEDFVPPPSAAPPDHQNIQQTKFDNIKTVTVAIDNHLERTYVDVINAKKAEIVVLSGEIFAQINQTGANYPAANERLVTTTGAASGDPAEDVVNAAGISTFTYPNGCDSDPSTCNSLTNCCLVGTKGTIYPDILAASHFPNLSNGTHTSGIVPAGESDRTFTRVSRNSPGQGNYASNTLGIGQTLYASNDANYRGAESVVTSQSTLGTYYFFSNASNVDSTRASQINTLMNEITALRNELQSKITSDANQIREQKHQEELNTWFMDAGYRTDPVKDYASGVSAMEDPELSAIVKEYDG